MSNQPAAFDSIKEYLPATLGPSAIVDAIEHKLTAPYRRTYDVWLSDESA